MQSKAIIHRLKTLEKKAFKGNNLYVFCYMPTKAQLALLPPTAKIVVITGEEELED